jgi:hypothetical protein
LGLSLHQPRPSVAASSVDERLEFNENEGGIRESELSSQYRSMWVWKVYFGMVGIVLSNVAQGLHRNLVICGGAWNAFEVLLAYAGHVWVIS